MTMFNTIVPPNSTQYRWGDCRYTSGGYPNDATFANTSSNHPGGVNVLMADGSVKFVKNTINQATWWALGHPGQRRGHLGRCVLMADGRWSMAKPSPSTINHHHSFRPTPRSSPRA